MARPLRIEYEGAIYHITARGNERSKIFFKKRDYLKFKEYLAEAETKYGFFPHAYTFNKNPEHYSNQRIGRMRVVFIPHFIKFCILCLSVSILSGCITTVQIQKLPTTAEAFQMPPDKLRAEYPEIAEYEKTFRGFVVNTPYSKQLISAWGEPDQKKTGWEYPVTMGATLVGCGFLFGPVPALITAGMVVAIRPLPYEKYYWRKDHYCIEAIFDRLIFNSYKDTLAHWKWHHMNDGKDIPEECRKQETTTISTETNK
jgi:hypothetical protein